MLLPFGLLFEHSWFAIFNPGFIITFVDLHIFDVSVDTRQEYMGCFEWWLYNEVDKAYLTFGDIRSATIHKLADIVSELLFGISLMEEFDKEKLTPF